ncbi:reverse transcriptase family protein [Beggiatoa alba]|uniref:hypothetical protein n=1 Tax=Beggiatoa alba TaxID=1022 RepID=UPI0002F3A160|nr:hypothetical protein [Beggiatoa alba]
MGKYLEKAMSPAVLNHVWRYFKNERGLWCHGISVEEMQSNLIKHVGLLSEKVLAGKYQPERMNCFEIDKADGKKRLICSSVVQDRLVQRAILTVIEPLGEAIFHESSFGYRPQCTVDMAVAKVREWVQKDFV